MTKMLSNYDSNYSTILHNLAFLSTKIIEKKSIQCRVVEDGRLTRLEEYSKYTNKLVYILLNATLHFYESNSN